MKISELMIHLQSTYKDFGDIEVRASIYDSDWETSVEAEIKSSAVERYIATERGSSEHVLLLNSDEV